MDGTSNNFLEAEKDDSKRFKKESRNKKKQKLYYEIRNEDIICKFLERGNLYDVHQMELAFIDSAGNRKILRKMIVRLVN